MLSSPIAPLGLSAFILILGYIIYSALSPDARVWPASKEMMSGSEEVEMAMLGPQVSLPATRVTSQKLNQATVAPECQVADGDGENESTVQKNTVVLLATLDDFPWMQIPPQLKKLEIKINVFVGPQERNSYLLVDTAGFAALVIEGVVSVVLFGTRYEIGPIHFPGKNYPVGTVTVLTSLSFEGNGSAVAAMSYQGPRAEDTGTRSDAISIVPKLIFPKDNSAMTQGKGLSALQTTVTWS